MKKQKIGAVLLTGVMILGMTGCGNSTANAYSKYVTLGDYKGIEYTMTVQEVTDEDIENELDNFVDGLENTEVTDRAIENGDIVNIDFVGTMDGEEFDGGSSTGYELEIGSNSFIDGFEEGLIGHDIGEEVSLDLAFPDPYEKNPDFSGLPVNFKTTINSISIKPELTDDLIKENTDYDTIEAYKEYIAEDLKEKRENTATQQAKNDIFNKVIENCTINGYDENEAKELVDKEFENFRQMAESYESYGYSYEDVLSLSGYDSEDSLKEGITEYVESYLKQKMVLYCIADKEGIKVTSEETDKRVQEYMDTYGIETKEEVYSYYGDDYFEIYLLSEKVMDFLMENAVLVDSIEDDTDDSDATTEANTENSEATTEADTEDSEATTEADTEDSETTTETNTEDEDTEAEETEDVTTEDGTTTEETTEAE